MKNKDRVAVETDHGYTVFDIEDGGNIDIGDTNLTNRCKTLQGQRMRLA